MARNSWSLFGCCAVVAVIMGPLLASADDSTPSFIANDGSATESTESTASSDYPQVTCTGTNPAVVADILQLATDSRDNGDESLGSLLKLGPHWRYPVHITVLDDDATAIGARPREKSLVVTDGHTLRIEASLPSDDLDARAFVQRQFVTAMLWEKYFAPDATFSAKTRLDVVPVWLVEGLREWLNDDPERNRDEIVKRAALAQRAPTLAEVTGWQDLSDDRLTGLWRRAFCYYLVDSLIDQPSRRDDFQQWLASITGRNPRPAAWLFPTEMGWQRELLQAGNRSRNLVYTWDESAAEMTADETIALPKGDNEQDTRLCTIETVSTFPRSKEIDAAVAKKINQLTALQLRVHPGWQRIVELYRFGLTALVRDNDPKRAAQYLHEAHVERAQEVDFHSELVDYMNWFEVTQNMPIEASHFQAYFRTAQELDKMQADPAHPNPLRSDLLKVESRF
jgi:hypothetical protein